MFKLKELEKSLPEDMNRLMANVRDYDDHASFAILFHMSKKSVERYILGSINSSSDVENLSQEIFTRLWANRRNFWHEGQFQGFLFGIVTNVVNSFKRQQFKERIVVSMELFENIHISNIQRNLNDYSHPQETLIIHELLQQAENAVANLPSRYKNVFKLIVEQNCTVKQTATLLHRSETTVRRHYKLAIKKLRHHLSAKQLT